VSLDAAIPSVDRAQEFERYDTEVSVMGVANHDAVVRGVSDALDVSIPTTESSYLAKPSQVRKSLQTHQGRHRHLTGITAQEAGRSYEITKDISDTSLTALQEHEIDEIVGHVKEGSTVLYEIKWKNDPLNTWQDRSTFNQTEILEDYWSNLPNRDTPR
jgi:hypothetical protein